MVTKKIDGWRFVMILMDFKNMFEMNEASMKIVSHFIAIALGLSLLGYRFRAIALGLSL